MSERRLPPPLIALTPGDLDASKFERFLTSVDAAIGAGLRGILVREPQMSDRELLALAGEIGQRLPHDGYLSIHDRVYLAEPAAARSVHLGFRSLTPREARAILPDDIAIGFSAHAHDAPASWEGADYLFFGPVFDTPSKRGIQEPVGIEGLSRAVAIASVPVLAIGGLAAEHGPLLVLAGARGMAVRRGVFGAADPAAAVRAFDRAL